MAERAVGTAEGEVVREVGDRDREVGGHVVVGPEVAQVDAVRDEGEVGPPGGVEAGGADDDVDLMFFAFVVGEALFSDRAYWVGEDGRIWCEEGFEVAWCWGWAAAAWVEVFGDDFFAEAFVVVEFGSPE